MTPQEMYANALRATAQAHGNNGPGRPRPKMPVMDTMPRPYSGPRALGAAAIQPATDPYAAQRQAGRAQTAPVGDAWGGDAQAAGQNLGATGPVWGQPAPTQPPVGAMRPPAPYPKAPPMMPTGPNRY